MFDNAEITRRYGSYRQVFAWSALKVFSSPTSLALQKENTFDPIYRRTMKELDDKSILELIEDNSKVELNAGISLDETFCLGNFTQEVERNSWLLQNFGHPYL